MDGSGVEASIRATIAEHYPPKPPLDIFVWCASRFTGEPPPRRWLTRDVLPLGVVGIVAAQGDTGKSMSVLDLARRVAFGSRDRDGPVLGGEVIESGTAVLLTAEDDAAEVHRRLDVIDDDYQRNDFRGDKLIVVPLPSAGGSLPLFKITRDGMATTPQYERLREQLLEIDDLRLVSFDPLQAFAQGPINEDPAAGQFVGTTLGALAAEAGATVLLPHHMKKALAPPTTLAQARELVRGTSALIDGVRVAIGMWTPAEDEGRRVCRELGLPYAPNVIVRGGVIKANGPANRSIRTYARNSFGLLVDRTDAVSLPDRDADDQLDLLVGAIRWAATQGQPFTKTGQSGLYENRERLPEDLRGLSKHKLPEIAATALAKGAIVQARSKGRQTGWLDVPGGAFAKGEGELRFGAVAAPE